MFMVNQLVYYNYLMIFTNIDLKMVINGRFGLIFDQVNKFLLFVIITNQAIYPKNVYQ
jgi:hypothetical protein